MSKPSYAQRKTLTEFLERHPTLASGMMRTDEARRKTNQLWAAVAVRLNAAGIAHRNGKDWHKYWVDKKSYLKKRLAAHSAGAEVNMSELDQRLLTLLGKHRGPGEDYTLESVKIQQRMGTAGEVLSAQPEAAESTAKQHDLAEANTGQRSLSSSPKSQRSSVSPSSSYELKLKLEGSPPPALMSPSPPPAPAESPAPAPAPSPVFYEISRTSRQRAATIGSAPRRRSSTALELDWLHAIEKKRLELKERRLALEERRFVAEQKSAVRRLAQEQKTLEMQKQRLALAEQRCSAEQDCGAQRLALEQQRLSLEEQRFAAEQKNAARRHALEENIAASLARIAEGLLKRWR